MELTAESRTLYFPVRWCSLESTAIYSAAAKFLLCRAEALPLYEQDLMTSFARFHYIVGGDVMGRLTLVLTPEPRQAGSGPSRQQAPAQQRTSG